MSLEDRAQRKDGLRTVILSAARELFVQVGYESFSMRKLAARVGCSPGNLYLYFKNREDIFELLVEETFGRLTTLLNGLCSRNEGKDPLDVLKKGLYTYVDFGLRNPHDYRFAFLMNPSQHRTTELTPAPVAVLGRMVSRCVEEGRLTESDPEVITQTLWAAVHGITSLMIQRPAFAWAGKTKVIDQLIAMALAGVTSASAPHDTTVHSLQTSVA
jgi:AcrR family transcriptional regulator